MQTKVKKDELLDIIRENRAKHRTVFEAALDGYGKQAKAILKQKLKDIDGGRTPELRILLSRPQDHTVDYDRVIKMLEMDTGTEFVLTEEQFAQYVMDDWRWKRDWMRMSNSYAAATTQQVYADYAVEDAD